MSRPREIACHYNRKRKESERFSCRSAKPTKKWTKSRDCCLMFRIGTRSWKSRNLLTPENFFPVSYDRSNDRPGNLVIVSLIKHSVYSSMHSVRDPCTSSCNIQLQLKSVCAASDRNVTRNSPDLCKSISSNEKQPELIK